MKQLIRNALGVAIATLAIAAPLHAAPPADGHFELLTKAAPNNWFNRTGEFTAAYATPGNLASPLNSAFYVFCVDRPGSISPGDNYDVWVSELSPAGIALGKTQTGNYDVYQRQAFLVQTFFANGGSNDLSGSENDWQWAIWGLGEAGGLGATEASFKAKFGDYQGGLAWGIITSTGALGAAGAAFDATDWRVITDATPNCNRELGTRCQELIFKSGSPPQEIVPEPATMSLLAMGLAGMAGAGIRRRKQSK
ncbi:MAG: PEP-CTERM sorting domain-containing protein [Gemmatimonadota bacterium]